MVSQKNRNALARRINIKAKEFGADLAGTVSLEDLKRSPSHRISKKMPRFDGIGTVETKGRRRGVVKWPDSAKSAIVIAVEHPPERPEMDWWLTSGVSSGNTPGNRRLMETVSKLAAWLENQRGVQCFKLPYHIEHGGVYMKDAAVLGGLGCIGKNNLFVSRQYGPRVRLRVMLTDADLPSVGGADYDPCEQCPAPCREVCPQDAFAEPIFASEKWGHEALPGRSGIYDRFSCNEQMLIDKSNSERVKTDHPKSPEQCTRYCRECEMACPVGLE